MATMTWLRLWHDMPNDPKWRTVARVSKQPISLVLSVFLHLMVDASRNVTRGHASVTHEDLASALDCDEQQISAILDAMQGRVLDGMRLLGWDARQPKREDLGDEISGAKSAAQRKREQRQREKDAIDSEAKNTPKNAQLHGISHQCHEASRNVTLDKDTDKSNTPSSLRSEGGRADATPPPPAPKSPKPKPEKREDCTLATFLANCKAQGVKPVPDDHAIRRWSADAGITDEMLQIAWIAFRERYTEDEQYRKKRYRDWAGTFSNSVKDRWFGLWMVSGDGSLQWTSAGLQRKRVLDARQTASREGEHEPA